jgi:glycogen debranching enzyme
LLPGDFPEARAIIINFASTMRHGLIPNLLDGGVNPRYNARDATWFFMNAIVEYMKLSGDVSILKENVNMIFLSDNMDEHLRRKAQNETKTMLLEDVMHHILQMHVKGISFREWRAGRAIDEQMRDEGFNVQVRFNKQNGFIYGGNLYNCGTWMDKMGSSEFARNKGIPATPRNGANIEIIALLYTTLSFLNKQFKQGKYSHSHVNVDDNNTLSYDEWATLIQTNFEKEFYIESKQTYRDYIYYAESPSDKEKYVHYEEQISRICLLIWQVHQVCLIRNMC